ncbi:MAG: ribosome maturation factor RimP [Xanthomonadaceae bacterium]|jgi:ribosome maturation factor RimP|nr:ribosome maturation factor RimP [Xanthomonadaceae bacterium]
MSTKTDELTAMLAPVVAGLGLGLELQGIEFAPSRSHGLLRLYIDLPGGERPVSVDDCEAVSREVSAVLDVHDPIASAYTLEVSSPGLDRLIFTPAQALRFAGQQVKVALALPQDGRRRVQGVILRADADALVVGLGDGGEFAVPFVNIDKARLVPDYAALGLAPAGPKAPRPRRQRAEAPKPKHPGTH